MDDSEMTAAPLVGGSPALRAQEVVIDDLGGNCPVQAEGTIDGKRFYFRARGKHWSLEVHPTTSAGYENWPVDDGEWHHREQWGDGPYAAGWMPEDVAREMIAKGAEIYRNQQRGLSAAEEPTSSEAVKSLHPTQRNDG